MNHIVGESPDDLYRLLAIEASAFVLSPQPNIVLFDDLLTTGSHFKACQRLLKERFPDCTVSGLFIGRAKHINNFDETCWSSYPPDIG